MIFYQISELTAIDIPPTFAEEIEAEYANANLSAMARWYLGMENKCVLMREEFELRSEFDNNWSRLN